MGMTSIGLSALYTAVTPRRETPARGNTPATVSVALVDRGNQYSVEIEGSDSGVRDVVARLAKAAGLATNQHPGVRLWLELSTAHLPAKLREFHTLNQYAAVLAYEMNDGDYSAYQPMLLWVPDDPVESASVYDDEDQPPAEVLALQLHARKLGCDYIRFDRDADTVDGLPTFEG